MVLHHRYKGERKVRVFNEPNRPALREDTVMSNKPETASCNTPKQGRAFQSTLHFDDQDSLRSDEA